MSVVMTYLGVYILTFNCARNLIQPDVFASHLFDALPKSNLQSTDLPEILVLSLQEIAPVAYSFLGGSFLYPYFDAFTKAVNLAAGGDRYQILVTRNVGMTALMVFVHQDSVDKVSWVETAEVGVGVQEAGNKGAVGARIGYQASSEHDDNVDLTFVGAHLAPTEPAWERRNEDWKKIAEQLVFTKLNGTGVAEHHGVERNEEDVPLLQQHPTSRPRESGLYLPTSYTFVAGDLNYRTSDTLPTSDDYKKFPQPTEDLTSSHHLSRLLESDQLTRELRAQRTLHNFTEMPLAFPPTYKFSMEPQKSSLPSAVGKRTWAKNRWPSWCDRILYLNIPSEQSPTSTGGDSHVYTALPLLATSDHRPVAFSTSVPLQPISASAPFFPPFEINPDWKAKRAAARRKEVAVGIAAYLGLTWEGNGLILATCLGILGGYIALRSAIAG